MSKKLVSLFLTFSILFVTVFSSTSCSSNNNDTIKFGRWLEMVNDAFGMQSYTSDTPYFANIGREDPYFSAVQIATEWNVIDRSAGCNPEELLTWRQALVSLVNVGSFVDNTFTEEQKIEFAINNFNNSIRTYWMDRNITLESATLLLSTVQEKWANLKYEKNVEKTKFSDKVKDYSNAENKIENYIYDVSNSKVVVPKDENIDVVTGDTFVLPANKANPITTAFKVEDVQADDQNYYITVDDDLDLFDIAENMQVGEAYVSTIFFDNVSDVLHDRIKLSEIPKMSTKDYTVCGCTALLDVIGGAIKHIGNIHKYARPEDVPAHTMFIITTDGQENASTKYSSDAVKQMIKHRKEKYGWEFLCIGANNLN